MILLKILLIALAVVGGIIGLVLLIAGLLVFSAIGVRISNAKGKLAVWVKFGLLSIKITPKKPKSEKALAEKQRKKEKKKLKKAKKAEKRALKEAKDPEKTARRLAKKQASKAKKLAKKNKKKAKKKQKKAKKPFKPPIPSSVTLKAALTALADYDYEYAKLIRFNRIYIDCRIGGEDACRTALAYGRACRLFGLSYPHAMRIFDIRKHRLNVYPDFIERKSEFTFDLTLTLRLARAARAGLVFFKGFKNYKTKFAAEYAAKQEADQDGKQDSTVPEK
ncbi:MAG: DUF2953 domain-containing protein [Clostridia bacterium]|nr:DUF2953 domain-containing protein [Clostridia bacterium]